MRAVAVGLTDVGLQREHNEDSFAVAPQHDLFVVADGMGGHQAGDVASRLATKAFLDFFDTVVSEEVTWPFAFDPTLTEEENRLVTGVRLGNRHINELSKSSLDHQGMGTTVVAALFSPRRGRLYVAHVGDSRAYRIRHGKIEQITRDHSLVNEYLAAMPDMPDEQRSELPKNVITRALGMQEQVQVDLGAFDAEPEDLYLLCSDGLSGMLEDEELCEVALSSDDLTLACRRLIDSANEHGGEDNVTAVLIRIEAASADEMRATLPDQH
jgi:serine/threonine protein phosphatase PrpC